MVFNPLLYFVTENILGARVFTFTGISSVVASQKFHQNFYQVEPQFATTVRPSYDSQSGYLGTTFAQGFSKLIFNQVNAFIGVSYSNHKGAANKNSPLFKEGITLVPPLVLYGGFMSQKSEREIFRSQPYCRAARPD